MLLRIGDLWRGQALLAKPEYELEEFRDIEIGRDTVSVVKAGSSFDDGTFLIPLGEHPWAPRRFLWNATVTCRG